MTDFQRAIDILTKGDRHRVWSLIVTVFGDLAREDGDQISAQTLGKLTEPLGVKPEALRVALHRLRKEGWLESQRTGRSSTYFLTGFGLSQTTLATPRIYCQTTPDSQDWHLLLASGSSIETAGELTALENAGSIVRLGQNSYLGSNLSAKVPADVLTSRITQSELPEWVRNAVVERSICDSYAKLETSFAKVLDCLNDKTNAHERATLRTLIVHSWRRIRLKHLDVPDYFYPNECRAAACRDLYLALLKKLPRPSLADINEP